jgi:hypothetical protein
MRSALEVADIVRRHGPAYRQAHAAHLGRTERRVLAAIEACRTPALGGHAEHCEDCGLVRYAYNSCRDRHCPKCQGLARADWLAARQAELLPVPYFHVVFTLGLARSRGSSAECVVGVVVADAGHCQAGGVTYTYIIWNERPAFPTGVPDPGGEPRGSQLHAHSRRGTTTQRALPRLWRAEPSGPQPHSAAACRSALPRARGSSRVGSEAPVLPQSRLFATDFCRAAAWADCAACASHASLGHDAGSARRRPGRRGG